MKNDQGHLGQPKLAVLVDADNTQASIVEGLLAEIAKYGVASVKRIYGDWTSTNLRSWKDKLLEYAIQPVQQFSYTTGKNATDSAMIIDAMDLLYTESLDGFCIVSSDSDFTRLAARLREDGKLVLGFGQRKTPKPFVAACDKFIYTEILREPEEERGEKEPAPKAATDLKGDRKVGNLLRAAVEDAADEFRLGLPRGGGHLHRQSPARVRSPQLRLSQAGRPHKVIRSLRDRRAREPYRPGQADIHPFAREGALAGR